MCPDQIIQPWQFGHKETKKTCLWLRGLPLLNSTKIVEPVFFYAAGKKYSPTHYNSKSSQNIGKTLNKAELSQKRSTTYQGIAEAMAKQWTGQYIKQTSLFNL